MAADASLLLRMRSQGGKQVAADVRAIRDEAKALGTDTARSSSMGSHAIGGLTRSTGTLGGAFAKVGRASVDSLGLVGRGISKLGSGVSKTTGGVTSALGKLRGGMEGISKVATGAGVAGIAGFFGVEAIQKATEGVQQLAEGASALHNVAGLSQTSALQLVAVANAIGISGQKLGVSLKTMSTQATAATTGTKSSQKAFKALGISMHDLKGAGGDTQKLLTLIAEGLEKTRGGATKTAAAAKLLGRGWMALNPLLEGGGKEMRSLEKFAGKLGITLSGNTAKNLARARDAGFRFHLVMMAAQLFIVNKLVPTLLNIAAGINKHVLPAFRWMAGAVKDASHWLGNAAGNVGRFFTKIGKSDVVRTLGDVLKIVATAAGAVAQAVWWVIQRISNLRQTIANALPSLHDLLNALVAVSGGGFGGIGGGTVSSAGSVGSPNTTPATSGLPGAGTANLMPIINPKLPPSQGLPPGFTVNARRGASAAVVHQVVVNPVPVHAHFHWNNREVGKAVTMAGAEAKATR